MNPNKRQHSFELFGLDFMVDQTGRVYFLEANSGPSLDESNVYLSSLLRRMMGRPVLQDNLFSITVDKLFPPPSALSGKPFSLEGFEDDDNLW